MDIAHGLPVPPISIMSEFKVEVLPFGEISLGKCEFPPHRPVRTDRLPSCHRSNLCA